MADFERVVLPGMTHWQPPRFFAYFPANAAPPSMIAEMLVTTIAAQCMLWQTSPAATEMEGVMLDWLRQALALPDGYTGVIQDSASSATLSAVLTMRERAIGFSGNREGLHGKGRLRIYCSDHVHSSIDRAAWVAGIGQENLVKLPTRAARYGLDVEALRTTIREGRPSGGPCAGWRNRHHRWHGRRRIRRSCCRSRRGAERGSLHPSRCGMGWRSNDLRGVSRGFLGGRGRLRQHCHQSPQMAGGTVRLLGPVSQGPTPQLNTLKIEPEYLKTTGAAVTNYSEWTIPPGRRFRALKIWFLIRSYGLDGLKERLRDHVLWASEICELVREMDGFEIVPEPILSLFTFRCPWRRRRPATAC